MNIAREISTTTLPVMESFYTLQGEGYHTGKAAYFIRLGGCDVGCVWCDVKDSWDAAKHPQFSVTEILEKIKAEIDGGWRMADGGKNITHHTSYIKHLPIIVITGGEPLMHNLDELTNALHEAGFKINIETSGSSPLSGNLDWICLSPKKFKAPLPEVLPKANELKIIVFNKHDFEWAETYASQVPPNCKLYLQPEWDKRETVTPLIIDYIKQNPKWQLSLQTHKYIGVP